MPRLHNLGFNLVQVLVYDKVQHPVVIISPSPCLPIWSQDTHVTSLWTLPCRSFHQDGRRQGHQMDYHTTLSKPGPQLRCLFVFTAGFVCLVLFVYWFSLDKFSLLVLKKWVLTPMTLSQAYSRSSEFTALPISTSSLCMCIQHEIRFALELDILTHRAGAPASTRLIMV